MSLVVTLPHLPGYLASQGYHTVLVRPKDKARPGIRLQNFFGFQTTVFHDDLPYTGRIAGWGKIPDQYTIGYVDEEVLEPLQGPTFSFFHLVTGHFPWDAQADPVWDWRRLNDIQTGPQVRYRQRDVLSELRMHVRRYRRDEGPVTPPRALTESQHIEYLRAVNYGIASVAQQLIQNPPERPTLVLIMGDHQPPLLAADLGFEVPVHAYATDPALLEGFLEHGFAPGWLPAAGSIRHEGLFSLLVGALALADGQRPPPYLPEGIPGMRAP